jgi:hypothetical protein
VSKKNLTKKKHCTSSTNASIDRRKQIIHSYKNLTDVFFSFSVTFLMLLIQRMMLSIVKKT